MSGFTCKAKAIFAPRSSISRSMEIFMPSCERELGVDEINAMKVGKDDKVFVLKFHHRVAALIKRAVGNSISRIGGLD